MIHYVKWKPKLDWERPTSVAGEQKALAMTMTEKRKMGEKLFGRTTQSKATLLNALVLGRRLLVYQLFRGVATHSLSHSFSPYYVYYWERKWKKQATKRHTKRNVKFRFR